MSYQENRSWSDKFVPDIQRILQQCTGRAAILSHDLQDMQENTDMILMGLDNKRVACRVRRFSYGQRYPYDFTIRSSQPSGSRTELHKLLDGFGDLLFYGFTDASEQTVETGFIGDLRIFRQWYTSGSGIAKMNADGTGFTAFDRRQVPGFVLYSADGSKS